MITCTYFHTCASALVAGALGVAILLPADALSQTCPSGMISYWRLDESSGALAADSLGTNTGALIASPVWTSGIVNGSLLFNGTNYVRVEDSPSLNAVDSGITLEAWINLSDLAPQNQDIISKHASSGGYQDAYCLQVAQYPAGDQYRRLHFLLSSGGQAFPPPGQSTGYTRLYSQNTLEAGQWYHVAGVWDGTEQQMKMYINGVLDSQTIGFLGPIQDSALPVGIGRNGGAGWSEYFRGLIDEAAIYNRALTLAEIQQHYQNGLNGMGYCESPAPAIACEGFEPPLNNGAVKVKKNRVLPLKATLLDNGWEVTDADVAAWPVLQVLYDAGAGDAVDVTEYALSAGQGTEGNQFTYDGEWWHFNLKTKNYSAPGTYRMTMTSGDETEYTIQPTCSGEFVIE